MVLGVPGRVGVLVLLVQHEPLLLARPVGPRPHEHEPAAELGPEEVDVDLAVPDCCDRVVRGMELPRAAIPDDHVAGAVLPFRDDALEVDVVERVVLDVHSEMARRGIECQTFGNGPADQDAIDLEAEVIVEAPRSVTLHDEAGLLRLRDVAFARRLRSSREVALLAVRRE